LVKLFFFLEWYLPGTNSGGPVRSVDNLIQRLSAFEIFIFTRNTDYCSEVPYEGIVANQWTTLSPHVSVFYASRDFIQKERIRKLLLDLKPDVVYVNGVYSKIFNIWVHQLATKASIPCIIAARGMLSPHSTSVKPLKKSLFLAYQRLTRAYAQVRFHATSDSEAKDIERVVGAHKGITIIPNMPRILPTAPPPIDKGADNLVLIGLGRIAPEKGTLEGIKALQQVKGQVTLHLYGTCYNESYWQLCQLEIARLPGGIHFNYHGPLDPESTEFLKAIHQAHALLHPSAGENYGHSIVECLSQGKPVIISHHTPWQGLEANKAGFNLNPNDFEKAVTSLLQMDQSNYNEWSRGALRYFNEHIAAKNDKVLQQYHSLFTRG
jgi:glycosyltransferase involved in cell wall biosynthesis